MTDTSEGRPPRRPPAPPASYERQGRLNVVRLRQRRDGDGDDAHALWALDDAGVTLDGAAADELHDRFAR